MKEKKDFGGVGVAFGEGKEVEVGMANVEVLNGVKGSAFLWTRERLCGYRACHFPHWLGKQPSFQILGLQYARTLIPSSEKHGGTAELSSSASLRRMGNFSTADMGMSPR